MVLILVTTKVYWSGSCELEHVFFENTTFSDHKEEQLIDRIQKIWIIFKKQYPESYDGTLILLNAFEHEEEFKSTCSYLFFNVSYVKYSTIIGLMKLQLPIHSFGTLGTQVAIFDEQEQFILVGKRKLNQFYAPGLLTLPGGVLEQNDILNPTESLLRELFEEVRIKVKKPRVIAVLTEHTNYSTIILLKVILDQPLDENEIFTEIEDEFDNHKLYWLKKDQLQHFDSNQLMEGLSYLKENLLL